MARETIYDARGAALEEIFYDGRGNTVRHDMFLTRVAEVYAGGLAEAAGLQAGDYVFQYADWDYYEEGVDSDRINRVIAAHKNVAKELTLCRILEDGTLQFYQVTFPEGMLGLRIDAVAMDKDSVLALGEAYRNWKGAS